MDWLPPWHCIDDDEHDEHVVEAERELQRELGVEHPLYGLPVRAVGYRQGCDDALFAIVDGTDRVAEVHLTFTHNPPERLPYPATVVFPNIEVWASECMVPDHHEFD